MNTITLGIDLDKNVFSPHGVNRVGKAVTRKNSGLVFHCEAMQVARPANFRFRINGYARVINRAGRHSSERISRKPGLCSWATPEKAILHKLL